LNLHYKSVYKGNRSVLTFKQQNSKGRFFGWP